MRSLMIGGGLPLPVPTSNSIRVRGLATSGRVSNGLNLFGLLGSNYRADLSYACTVDYRGRVRDIDINRR